MSTLEGWEGLLFNICMTIIRYMSCEIVIISPQFGIIEFHKQKFDRSYNSSFYSLEEVIHLNSFKDFVVVIFLAVHFMYQIKL